MSQGYENFIAYIYHGGSMFNSKFWNETKYITNKHLQDNDTWRYTKKYVKLDKQSFNYNYNIFPFIPYVWNLLDKNLKYDIF